MIEAGQAPLWNPLRGSGQPLLANPNALVLHPTTLLFLALPFEWAFKLAIIGQVFLAGAGAWLALRDIGASRAGGLLGAAVFCLSGYVVSLGNLINLLDSAAFMPLTLWLAGRAVTRGFAPWGSLAAMSLAVQIMAGEPAILFCTAAAFAALHFSHTGLERAVEAPARRWRPRLAALAGVGLLAAALSMVALLPAVELLPLSERGAGLEREEVLKWSLPPAALLEVIVPRLFGDPTRADVTGFWGGGLFDAGLPFILSLHLGPGALLLAVFALAGGLTGAKGRRGETIALGAMGGAGIALALGRFLPLYPALLSTLPPLQSARYPVKYFLLVTWAVSVLAARGYDAIGSSPDIRRRCAGALRWGLLPVLLVSLADSPLSISRGFAATALRLPEAVAGPAALEAIGRMIHHACTGAAFAGLLVWAAMSMGFGRIGRFVLFAVTIAPLLLSGAPLNPVAPAAFYEEPPLVAGLLDRAGGTGRVWAAPRPKGFAFRTPEGGDAGSLVAGFRWDRMTLRNATYFSLGFRFAYDRGNERLDIMPGAAIGRALAGMETSPLRPEATARLLSLAGVDRLLTYGGLAAPGVQEAARLDAQSNVPVVVMRNARALPRVWIARRIELIPDVGAALRRLDDPSFDPATTAVVGEPTLQPPAPSDASGGVASIETDEPSRVVVRATTPASALLVLGDSFYPGWKARVDGAESHIYLANAMFRAVAVPPGEHTVEFLYAPSSVRSGLMVTAAALLLAALLAVPRRR